LVVDNKNLIDELDNKMPYLPERMNGIFQQLAMKGVRALWTKQPWVYTLASMLLVKALMIGVTLAAQAFTVVLFRNVSGY
jgi:hypothetical protein